MSKILKINPLTPLQEGMLYHNLLNQEGRNYCQQVCFNIEGKIDLDLLKETWQQIVNRYEVFRTDFIWKESKVPVQIVLREKESEIYVYDISDLEDTQKDKYINDLKEKDLNKPFDFENGKLNRLLIVKLSREKYLMCWSFHHILIDGWSLQLILKDFLEIYDCLANQGGLPVEPAVQFSNYLEWLKKQDRNKAFSFWKNYLRDLSEPTLLQGDYPTSQNEIIKNSREIHFEIDQKKTDEINEFCRNNNITVNSCLQTAWGLLLQRYNNTDISCFGMTVSGRSLSVKNVEKIVGILINTLPIVIKTEENETIKDLVTKVNDQLVEIRDYEYVPLTELKSRSNIDQIGEMFNSMIAFENYPQITLKNNAFSLSLDSVFELTNYDLTISFANDKTIMGKVIYNADLFTTETVERILKSMNHLIDAMLSNSEELVQKISIVSEEEKKQLLAKLSGLSVSIPKEKTISQLFEEQVERAVDEIAVVFGTQQLTYCELNQKSNQLARRLREEGVQSEEIVAIMVDQSLEMFVGIMGILKAGGAYLPIDPQYPQARIEYMLKDSKAKILLTQKHLKEEVLFDGEIILLNDSGVYTGEVGNLKSINYSNNLAYIIYTSGSTGQPKGVMIEHRSLINLVTWHNSYYEVTSNDQSTKYAGFGFDASVWEIFPYLIAGATIHVILDEIRWDAEKLNEYFTTNSITISFLPTQICEQFMETGNTSLRKLLTGGDKLKIYKEQSYELINNYGPTENTVVTTSFVVNENERNIPIGKPIFNTQIYILDKNNNLQPIGAAGDLCIAGEGLARGYLHRPELTNQKFVQNPYASSQKMYKTGDLARMLPNGNIEFLGRVDYQVKIRGFRIELGEIENQLLEIEKIKEVAVIDREDEGGNKYLCAYIVSDTEIQVVELREILSETLPDYMIPAFFIQLEKLPLTVNGKLDKRALPKSDESIKSREYVAPANEEEEKMARIWSEILRVEKVSINDNFFELGGHSLKATQLASRVFKIFNVELPLKAIFKYNTVKKLVEYICGTEETVYTEIKPVEKQEHYVVSSAQKRLFALRELSGDDVTYNIPMVKMVFGELDFISFENAWKRLIQRHESLRTSFALVKGQPVQKIHENVDFKIQYLKAEKDELPEIIDEFVQPFDLNTAPLFRVGLVQCGEQHGLILDMHHIISDGASVEILFRELTGLYEGKNLSEIKIQYKDFANWQNELFQSEEMKKQEEYWLSTFVEDVRQGAIPVLNMPTDAPRPSVMSYEGDLLVYSLQENVLDKLNKLSFKNGATLYMTLLAAFNILLHKYTSQEDLIVGSPIAGRRHDDLENVIGMFVNTLAMRNEPVATKTFIEFLAEVKENSFKAFENQDYQFEMLVEKLDLQRDLSRNPIFDVMFTLQKADQLDIYMKDLLLKPYHYEYKISKFDFTLTAVEKMQGIDFYLEYSSKLFTKETMERLLNHLSKIIDQILENPELKIAEIEMISEEEKEQILFEYNNTSVDLPIDKTIHKLFEDQVEKTPEKKVAVFEKQNLTYHQLNVKANQLARVLREKGVTTDQIVGILVDPSLEMLVGILGILKAGGAYLPIDSAYPDERIEYLLTDSGTSFLLTQHHLAEQINFSGEIINLEDEKLYTKDFTNLESDTDSTDLAYVIYTSGSTGKPKGVMIEHHSLVNLVCWHNSYYSVTSNDCSTKYAGFGFDASVWEIFPYIVSGATIHIISPEIKLNMEKLNQYFENNQITISFLPTQICEQFTKEKNHSLRALLAGGDKLKYYADNDYLLVNNYGPTENTVVTTSFVVDRAYNNIPIGKPIFNTKVYILNQSSQLQPVGVPGELCIVGESLARGYLHLPELTKEKFVWSSFSIGERMYKTGDLARWLPDGSIEFLGRVDRQVKIRGYRIELGEIESQLLQYKQVNEIVVIDREDVNGNKHLCAYYTAHQEMSAVELKEFLAKNLPDYMIPAFFVQIDQLPLTANGKVNRRELPIPKGDIEIEYIAPATQDEKNLAKIWGEILGIEKVGIHNNFFELGGDSIKAIQILARAKEQGIYLTVKDIFKFRTIANLLNNVDYAKKKAIASQEEVVGEVLLTPIQKWFFDQNFSQQHYFNQTNLFTLPNDVDLELLEKVLYKVISHHDALRMNYQVTDDQVIQYNRRMDEVDFKLEVFDLINQKEKLAKISEMLQNSLDLEKDLLMKAVVFDLGEDGKRLLIAIHHLVVDGVSWRILVEDINKLYEFGLDAKLPLKTTSFKEWSQKLNIYADTETIDVEYWEKLDQSKIQSIRREKVMNDQRIDQEFAIVLDKERTQQLLTKVNWAYNTEINDILLSALTIAICEVMGIDNLLVNLEGHGREEIIEDVDLSRTFGWFTSAYPVYFEKQDSLDQILKHVKENLRMVPNKGVNYGIAKFLKDVEQLKDLKPEVSFNYLGQFDDSFAVQENKNNRLLSGCTEDAGRSLHIENRHSHLIDVNGGVVNDTLQLVLNYDANYISQKQIKLIQEAYQKALHEIIEHCLTQKERIYTASDFGVENLVGENDFVELANNFSLKTVKMYPLTPMQEGMLFYHNLNIESRNYYEQFCFYLEGTIEYEHFKNAWEDVVKRHEIMRTCFFWKGTGKPIQIVLEETELLFDYYDLSNLSVSEQERRIVEFKEKDLNTKFDFEKGKLNRFSLLKISEEKYLVCWSFHHILLDGWSMPIIIGDLFNIYHHRVGKLTLTKEVAPQFGDYLNWLIKCDKNKGIKFWENYMKNFSETTPLPYDKKANKGEVISEVGLEVFEYNEQITQDLNKFCKQNNLTVNAFIQTIWGLLLQKYNNTFESCFGMTVSGRPGELKNVEKIAGLFINTLPVIVRTEEEDTALHLLRKVNDQLVEIRDYEYVSLAEIQSMVDHTDELFDSLIVFENYPVSSLQKRDNLDFALTVDSVFELTNYDFSISAAVADKTVIRFTYNKKLFMPDTITRIKQHFYYLMKAILTEPAQVVKNLEIISEVEKEQLLNEFNNSQVSYSKEKTIHQLFTEQVAKTPERTALIFKDQRLTYHELDEKTNQLARLLRENGVEKDTVVGLMLPRSLEMVIGIIGILKARGICLPIDQKYPKERIQLLLEDSGAPVLLKMDSYALLADFSGKVIDVNIEMLNAFPMESLETEEQSDDLAYLIYTSGSTGKPKGVMLHHKGIINHAFTKIRELDLTFKDRLCHNLTINFVASIWQVFSPLFIGSELIIYSEDIIHDSIGLLKRVKEDQISVLEIVPSLLKAYLELLDEGEEQIQLPDLRLLILTGEKVAPALVNKFYKKYKISLINAYGQSECSDDTLHYKIPYNSETEIVYVGKPSNNTKVYVLDKNFNLQPIGVAGELCISGDGLAKGYFNRPEMTEERFIANPFVFGQKMYRTGDRVRWTKDGYIEFLGRIDHQVKIRGYRIEPGEIENLLLSHQAIKEVVVIARQDQSENDYLCSYFVSDREISISELKEYLSKELPEYMIPAVFVKLERMPLTPNGKINRKALPEVDGKISTGREYIAPRDEIEEKLVQIWSQVIKTEKIGIRDDFFELGGHSLKAGILVAKINKQFNVELPLREIFNVPTIEGLAKIIRRYAKTPYTVIERVEEYGYYPVSSAQKRLFALHQIKENDSSYNVSGAFTLEGDLDKERFENALRELIKRHDAFRTSFTIIDGEPVQIIEKDVEFNLNYLEVEENQVEKIIAEFIQPFDLNKAPLLRVHLIQVENKHMFLFDMHHIIADGTSLSIFINELFDLYAGKELTEQKVQYKDFSAWQNNLFRTEMYRQQEKYWLNQQFDDEIPVLNMPTDYSRPSGMNFAGDMVDFKLGKETSAKLYELLADKGVTLYMTLLAAFNVLLAKYTNQDDIIVGSPIAGRRHADLEKTIGMFVNTLALRNHPMADYSFAEFLAEVKENLLQVYENQDYQFEMLVEKLDLERNLNRNPLFDVMLVLQNTEDIALEMEGLRFIPYRFENKIAKFDLTFYAFELEDEIQLAIEYATSLFKRDTIERMLGHFVNIVEEIVENPEVKLSKIGMISSEERIQLLDTFNDTFVDYPKEKKIYQLFEEAVERVPDHIALVFGDQQLTYRELNQKSNQLARVLRDRGVKTNQIVGILVERSIEMMIGIYGILKSGGAYLPLDQEYPEERIEFMLEDSGVDLLLVQHHLHDKIEFSGEIIDLEDESIYTGESTNMDIPMTSNDLAYIIYTSGSTGKPKGVMIEHKSLVNVIMALQREYPFTEADVYLLKTTYIFDVSGAEIYGWFMGTGKLVILEPDAEKETKSIIRTIQDNHITHINFVPSMLKMLLNTLDQKDIEILSKLKYVFVAGEAISKDLVRKFYRLLPNVIFENIYGPTESTIYATKYSLIHLSDEINVPIGKPIQNINTYILDKYNNLQPIGVAGELCLSGGGLARGYLNRPELTGEKFVSNPFKPGERMYKTGDLARWLPDGNIEYLGRIDHQVKVRGFRIELGEIENSLLLHVAITEAVVIDRIDDNGNKYLCAYVINESDVSVSDLREHLAEELPEYMIPSYFVHLEEMPLTVSGKINRKALPAPDASIEVSTKYVAATNELEEKMVEIWEEILRKDRIGIYDNFFELGGDSIKAIQITSRANQLGMRLTVKDVFKNKTIADMLNNIDYSKPVLAISQKEVEGEVLLTPIQKWFFEQDLNHPHFFNQNNLFRLSEDVDLALLENVFKEVIKHHDALRICYKIIDGQIIQSNRRVEEIDFKLELVDLTESSYSVQETKIYEISAEVQNCLDLETDLLFRGVVFDLGENGKRLLLTIHHLVVDGISWRILLEDIENMYISRMETELPLKTTSFRDWSQKLNDYAKENQIDISYWEQIDLSKIESLFEGQIEGNYLRDHQIVQIELTEEQTEKLLSRVNWAYNTEINDILLSALTFSITEVLEIETLLINLEGHGREEILKGVNLSRTIGWFTSTYPVYFEKQESISETIKHVKESLRKIPNKGVNFGIARELKNNPLLAGLNPEISFNYLGQFDGVIDRDSLLSRCKENSGSSFHLENDHAHLIDINGVDIDGKLQLSLSYNAKYLESNKMQLLQKLYTQALNDIIEHCANKDEREYTASDFGLENMLEEKDFETIAQTIELENVKMYALTPMQEGMLFHNLLNETGRNYCEQICFYLNGEIDIEQFNLAWQEVTNRHEIFRTSFLSKGLKNPVQIIFPEVKITLNELDLSGSDSSEQAEYISRFKEEDLDHRFDFENGKLNRVTVLKLADNRYWVSWTFHHILLDGWSVQIVLGELFEIYHNLVTNSSSLSLPKAQFSDYLEWLDKQDRTQGLDYWSNYMCDFSEPALLPYDNKSKKGNIISEVMTRDFTIDSSKTKEINEFCKRHHLTINTLIQTSWGILLQKYNNTNESCFGTTVSGRPTTLENVESIVGIFINTLPVIVETEEVETVTGLLRKTNERLVEIREYEYISLAEIQKMSASSEKLFDSIIVFENYLRRSVQDNMLDFSIEFDSAFELSNYDFSMTVMSHETIDLKVSYNAALFNSETIERIQGHLMQILNAMLDDAEQMVRDILIVSDEEKEQILIEFNDTKVDYPIDQTIQQLFEEQVERTPENIALVFEEESLTYRELNQLANQLARVLREKGVGPDKIVGLMSDKSLEMIIGVLAIIKAGGAYLPIDIDYPENRVEYMLEDSAVQVLLIQQELAEEIPFEGEMIYLDEATLYRGDETNLENLNTKDDLIYIIYTSGSSGKPKGVMIEHKNVNRLINNSNMLIIHQDDRIMQTGSLAFDASTFEIWGSLLKGASLYLIRKDEMLSAERFEARLKEYRITMIWLTAPLFNQMLEENPNIFSELKTLISGGDALSPKHINQVRALYPELNVVNGYGPTESTTFTTYFRITKDYNDNIPIGRPVSNTKVYILDQKNQIQPIGVPGELCIAGDGLARGYLNRSDLTKEKFVNDLFVPGERMYKTGDLVRWLPDGTIEFLGRIDFQVKIRGFRIELGEIENQLLNHGEIKEAIVLYLTDVNNAKYLCGYIVADRELTVSELRGYLSVDLPDYMIPSYFVQLEKMPLTSNGKINRRALPEPNGSIATGVEYVAPTNQTEERMAKIWSEILGIQQVGIYNDFFELGGHSLKATQLASKILKEFDVELPLKEIFQTPTIKGLVEYINSMEETKYVAIETVEVQEYYPVSSAQKRIFAIEQMEGESTTYNIPSFMFIEGELELEHFEYVFKELINRHESLRTSFEIVDGKPVQRVHQDVDFAIELFADCEGEPSVTEIEEIFNEFVKPFNLSKAPLLRVGLMKISEKKHLFMLDIHHIISDGTSTDIMFKEIASLYETKDLLDIRVQYKDFSAWQNKLFASEDLKKQEEYWLEVFEGLQGGEIPILNLPTDEPRPALMSFEGDYFIFEASEELTEKIHTLASSNGATLYMVLLSAFNLLLAKYAKQDDIVIGSPIAGRRHADLENIIGMFVNTLAMRNYPASDKTFAEFLSEVKENSLKAYENQDYQFEMLIEKLDLERDLSRNPLFDVLFVLQNANESGLYMKDLQFKPCKIGSKISKFDLTLSGFESDQKIYFSLEYSVRLFKPETIERMSRHFINLLKRIVEKPELQIAKIEMISEEERTQILNEFNDTIINYPKEKTIQQLFEEQVVKTPEKIAVVYEDQGLTYAELNAKANQLAHLLRAKGVESDQPVGIMTDKSLEMIIGVLAIIKAGGSYLPIDIDYPESRVEYMLSDSEAKILLIQKDLIGQVHFDGERIPLEDKDIYTGDNSDLVNLNQPEDLIYIIYTSGSTGKPKGVMVKHLNVNRLIKNSNMLIINENDRILQTGSMAFDASTFEVWGSLLNGATLYLISKDDLLSADRFETKLKDNEISMIWLTAPLFNQLLEENPDIFAELKTLIVGGDALSPKHINLVRAKHPSLSIINGYGPTESTTFTTYFGIQQEYHYTIPIGKPVSNTQVYILDQWNQLQPVGVPGELCIAGDGLARGYLGQPELTAEKFVSSPYRVNPDVLDEKMYRTGDLVRWLPDGNIEFLGRIDYQVKIRGFRIELSEIENQLLQHEAIKETVVLDKVDDNGKKYLCAYIVSEREIPISELREHCSKELPDYMIPSYFISLEKVPLTSNGKVDRRALPEPEGNICTETEYAAPTNEIEEKLSKIWKKVLSVVRVGINDNFFELGGDSIKAIQILSRANQEGINITVKDVFRYKTIANLIANVDYTEEKDIISQEEVEGEVLLLPIQRWFFEQNFQEPQYFNQGNLFALKNDVDLELLEKVFEKIIVHHDAIRMIYKVLEGQISQINRRVDEVDFKLEIIDLSNEPYVTQKEKIKKFANRIQDSLDLEKDLLIKAIIFDLGENGKRLFIPIHHLVIDGVSWRILLEDIETLYYSNLQKELPLKTTSFKEWSEKLSNYAKRRKVDISYWESIDQTKIASLIDVDEKEMHFKDDERLQIELDEEYTEKLLTKVNWVYNTEINDILLSALLIAITEVMEKETVLLNLEGHGREEILKDVDLSRTIGWFTSAYPVYFEKKENIEETIKHVKESLRRVPNKGLNFGVLRYLKDNKYLRELNPEISFNYLGQFDNTIETKEDTDRLLSACLEDVGSYVHPDNQHNYLIDINGMIISNKLQLSLNYNVKYFDKDLMSQLQISYVNSLKEIIDHCINQTTQTHTVSDFELSDEMDDEEFDLLNELYDFS
ncbi:MAG: non-ribosomal peptide synthase/polyketide synthase [Halanaerobiales bacterium]|nr:non-ribosomal peptide synthase/polyketide synthase [Halanaerobiales bacterium]